MLKIFKVDGDSMLPTLNDNDLVLVSLLKKAKEKDIIVIDIPKYGLLIKRIELIKNDFVYLVGDNKKYSSTACSFPHHRNNIIGVMLIKLPFFFNFFLSSINLRIFSFLYK